METDPNQARVAESLSLHSDPAVCIVVHLQCLCVCVCVALAAVCKSIQHPVTKEFLLQYVDHCVQAQTRKHPADPDSQLMPPPPPKRATRPIP